MLTPDADSDPRVTTTLDLMRREGLDFEAAWYRVTGSAWQETESEDR